MRRSILILLIILVVIVAIGVYLSHLAGYVLLVLPHWTMQLPIWLAALSIIIFFLLIYVVLRFIRGLFNLNNRFQHWLKHRQALRAQRALRLGIFAFLADELEIAQTQLGQAVKLHAEPLFTNLALALTAHKQGEYSKRDEILQTLQHDNPAGKNELGIFQARLQIESRDFTAAHTTLEKLHYKSKKHLAVQRLLAEVYYQQNQFFALKELLPMLKKYPLMDTATYAKYCAAVGRDLLLHADEKEDLLSTWRHLDEITRQQFSVLQTYIQQLIKLRLGHEAEIIVRSRIEQHASDDLYTLYASIPNDTHLQILQIESWLKRGNPPASLLLAAGELCARYQLWGKARDYFTSSLQKKPDAKVYASLAKLYNQIGDKEKAEQCYKLGLELAAKP